MTETVSKLEGLIKKGFEYLEKSSDFDMKQKSSPEKWSKKEILGHLIDSAINNLQRFTEIHFEIKPYKIKPYNQTELVIANNYQNASIQEITNFWLAINNRILNVISQQTEHTINYKIKIDNDEISDLKYLITDYVNHLEHHLNQIID